MGNCPQHPLQPCVPQPPAPPPSGVENACGKPAFSPDAPRTHTAGAFPTTSPHTVHPVVHAAHRRMYGLCAPLSSTRPFVRFFVARFSGLTSASARPAPPAHTSGDAIEVSRCRRASSDALSSFQMRRFESEPWPARILRCRWIGPNPPAGANEFAAATARSPPARTRRPGRVRHPTHLRVRSRGTPRTPSPRPAISTTVREGGLRDLPAANSFAPGADSRLLPAESHLCPGSAPLPADSHCRGLRRTPPRPPHSAAAAGAACPRRRTSCSCCSEFIRPCSPCSPCSPWSLTTLSRAPAASSLPLLAPPCPTGGARPFPDPLSTPAANPAARPRAGGSRRPRPCPPRPWRWSE